MGLMASVKLLGQEFTVAKLMELLEEWEERKG